MAMSFRLLVVAATIAGMAGVAHGQDPAVSALNGKVGFKTGYAEYDGDNAKGPTALFLGSVTAPVGIPFGVQLDGAIGDLAGRTFASIGGHAFWRNPKYGLFGVVGQFASFSGATAARFGPEGEAYLGRFSIMARILYQTGRRNAHGTILIGRGIHTTGVLRWYPDDDLMLKVGAGIGPLLNHGSYQAVYLAGAEWQPRFLPIPGLALFADGEAESRGDFRISVGLRLYLGGNDPTKSLIRRHREDDPPPIDTNSGQTFQQGNPKPPPPSQACQQYYVRIGGQCVYPE